MNYFVCTYGNWDERYPGPDFVKISKDTSRYWFHEYCRFPSAVGLIKKDDIILLKNGCLIVAWGKARDGFDINDTTKAQQGLNGWCRSVKVYKWNFLDDADHFKGIHHYGIGYNTLAGGQYSVIKQVTPSWAEEKLSCFESWGGASRPSVLDSSIVDCDELPIEDLLKANLRLPDYQRAFTWTRENVIGLLNGIKNIQDDSVFYLGTVILKRNNDGHFDVIDGQQRLTTLSFLAFKHDGQNSEYLSLLRNTRRHISEDEKKVFLYGMKCVDEFSTIDFQKFLQRVRVNVVVIPPDCSEDLAYLFFSTTNSTGVKLSDFDLLKSHHLRYVAQEHNQELAARKWAELDGEPDNMPGFKNDGSKALMVSESLLYRSLYRVRKWGRREKLHPKPLDPNIRDIFNEFKVKTDPFFSGYSLQEKATFNSLLSGGMEFFRYVEAYSRKYRRFREHEVVRILSSLAMYTGGGRPFCEAALAILFLYYCRFDDTFIFDAAYAILYRISSIRNVNGNPSYKMYFSEQYRNVFEQCVICLERVNEPGMFLAWVLKKEDWYVPNMDQRGAPRYWTGAKEVTRLLKGRTSLPKDYRNLFGEDNK